jgi:tetratricopeptide (TPR) repeat protein
MHGVRWLLVVAAVAACPAEQRAQAAFGQEHSKTVVTTVTGSALENGTGHEQRDATNKLATLLKEKKLGEAEEVIAAVLGYFEKLTVDPQITYRCFANQEELAYFKQRNPDIKNVVWLDHAFGEALHSMAFLLAARKQWDDALKTLDREIAMRPYFAGAHTERGYVLNRTGKHKEALASYQSALALAEKHASSKSWQGLALRGMGYALIELGDLPGARAAYERSLKVDPNNALAQQELEYIKMLESKKK